MQMEAALVVRNSPHGKAREQDLAMLPSSGPAMTFRTATDANLSANSRNSQNIATAKVLAPGAGASLLTKADLNQFVDQTLKRERAVVAGTSNRERASIPASSRGGEGKAAAGTTGLAHHPTWYDTQHHNEWCFDNPQFHGPFGDPCVAYATGGDRQFWCEWDGAGADNACPRSCGTCSWRSYTKDVTTRRREEHLLHEHFDPQEAPSQTSVSPGVQQRKMSPSSEKRELGPAEPKRTAQRRSMTGALLKEVSEMKDRLMQVAKATRAVAKEVALSRTSNHHLSSGQASADLANFYSAAKKKVVKRTDESDSSALNDLLDFFDQEPGGSAAAHSKDSQLAALRAKVVGKGKKSTAAVHGMEAMITMDDDSSTPQIVAELTAKEKEDMVKKAAAATKAAAERRLSGDAANKDINKYWGDFQAKARATSKVQDIRNHGMSAEAASKDLDSFLSKMVAKARVAHLATEAAAEARRAKTDTGREAVPVKPLSDKQARQKFEEWWGKDMAVGGVGAGATSNVKGVIKGDTKGDRIKSTGKGLATFSAASAAKELQTFWEEEFPTPKKARALPVEHAPHQHKMHSINDGNRREDKNEREEDRGNGNTVVDREGREERDASNVPAINRFGVPQGRGEAVRISHAHRTSAQASRGNLDSYFGKKLRRDNIAAAQQRLKQHPIRPIALQPSQALAYAEPQYQQFGGYAQPGYAPQYSVYGHAVPAPASPYAYGPPQGMHGGWQEMSRQAQEAPAKWPRTSLLNPMQAAFGAAYDGYVFRASYACYASRVSAPRLCRPVFAFYKHLIMAGTLCVCCLTLSHHCVLSQHCWWAHFL